jgi:polysaccharide biosynthesis protein PslG
MSGAERQPGARWRPAAIGVLVLAIVVAGLVVLRGGTPPPSPRGRVPQSAPATTPTQPALPAPPSQAFGASVNRLFNDFSYTPAQVDAQLAALRATGATVARTDALWEATEPSPPSGGVHHWVWTFDDTIAGALARHGLRWLAALTYSAPWAQSIPGQDHSPPRSADDYAAYARAFAARYGVGGTFWQEHPEIPVWPVTTIEIWNEPDNPDFWTRAPDPAGYARLYLAARAAIDAVDPSARVIVGGLIAPGSFLPAMVRAAPGLLGHVDGVAIHPYGTPPVVVSRVRDARRTLVGLHMAAVPLYATEFGWTTSPSGAPAYVAPARRPAWIALTLDTLGHLDCGLAATILYTWVTPEHNVGDSEDWFGIENPDGTGTPASEAFATGLRAGGAPGKHLACGK